MINIVINKFPKCPKCKKGELLPLAQPRENIGVKDYSLFIAKWKCSSCKHEIKHGGQYD